MKSWFKYIGLGVAAYLVFVIAQFPAKQAYALMENFLDDKDIPVELYEIRGTIWQGRASRLVYDERHFNDVKWQFLPVDILTGKLSAAISFKNADSFANSIVSMGFMGDISVEDTRASMSAQDILALAKIPAIKLGGQFDLNLATLELYNNKISNLFGRLVWTDAESMFPQKLELGNLFADMTTADDGTINVDLGDGGGPLELSGKLTVAPDGKYDLATAMASREGRNSMLGRSLGFMARYNSQGKAELKRSGNISEFNFLVK